MSIYIGEDYSAMQGPCPTGYHVPSKDEWQSIYDAYIGLGLSGGDNFATYLKLPLAGARNFSNLAFHHRGSNGMYWSYTPLGANQAYILDFSTSNINSRSYDGRSHGHSVRGLKNSPVTPTASWTKLYGTSIESGGIFHNSTAGLISISSDGTTWYTLMDKNLGATTVYNYGDALSESNCGKVFQWGNNYGFSGDENYDTSQITQSSTQVDVTGYGPGNYYKSSTWITANPRQSSANNGNNLRGGVTGAKPGEVSNIYIGEKPYDGDELCFTANTANSTVQLTKNGSPTEVTLETSTDGRTWTTYTFGDTITLSNVGDTVYFRNTSTTDTGFIGDYPNYYRFVMTGSIAGSGDITYLLNKNGTNTLSARCFNELFHSCSSLTTPPALPATTLAKNCYSGMFWNCSNLTSLPKLPATTLVRGCYSSMFSGCTKIKISETKTGEYQTPYRIPIEGTGVDDNYTLTSTFYGTGGTFTGTPSINTTYYTSNTVV